MDFGSEFDKTIINRKPWEINFRAGKIAFKRGDYFDAEKLLKLALDETSKFGDEDPRLGNIIKSLAELFQKTGKHEECGYHYDQVIQIWEKTLGDDYSGLIDVYEIEAVCVSLKPGSPYLSK